MGSTSHLRRKRRTEIISGRGMSEGIGRGTRGIGCTESSSRNKNRTSTWGASKLKGTNVGNLEKEAEERRKKTLLAMKQSEEECGRIGTMMKVTPGVGDAREDESPTSGTTETAPPTEETAEEKPEEKEEEKEEVKPAEEPPKVEEKKEEPKEEPKKEEAKKEEESSEEEESEDEDEEAKKKEEEAAKKKKEEEEAKKKKEEEEKKKAAAPKVTPLA